MNYNELGENFLTAAEVFRMLGEQKVSSSPAITHWIHSINKDQIKAMIEYGKANGWEFDDGSSGFLRMQKNTVTLYLSTTSLEAKRVKVEHEIVEYPELQVLLGQGVSEPQKS